MRCWALPPAPRVYPRWAVDFHLARFHYRRLQGDHTAALEMLEPALAAVAPGRHIDWALVASAHIAALKALGRHDEAGRLGLEYLATCDREDLSGTTRHLMREVAEALAKLGRFNEAVRLADECVHEAETLGITGVILGVRYEARARVALAMSDRDRFVRLSGLCFAEYRRGKNPALLAKHERLLREAQVGGSAVGSSGDSGEARSVTAVRELTAATRLSACRSAGERAAAALALLLEETGAAAGLLVALRDGELRVLAEAGVPKPASELSRRSSGVSSKKTFSRRARTRSRWNRESFRQTRQHKRNQLSRRCSLFTSDPASASSRQSLRFGSSRSARRHDRSC